MAILLSPALDCVSVPGVSVELVPASLTRNEEETVNLQCVTRIEATYPRWIIGNQVFTVTNLPSAFTVDRSNISFPFDGNVEIRCFYTVFSSGSVVNVCSNPSRIVSNGPRGKFGATVFTV